jgi:hypothetical protein
MKNGKKFQQDIFSYIVKTLLVCSLQLQRDNLTKCSIVSNLLLLSLMTAGVNDIGGNAGIVDTHGKFTTSTTANKCLKRLLRIG